MDGKVYGSIKRGKELRCPDCDLYEQCSEWARRGHQPCLITDPSGSRIFRYSKELTDKLNNQ